MWRPMKEPSLEKTSASPSGYISAACVRLMIDSGILPEALSSSLRIRFPAAPRLRALGLSSVWRMCATVTSLSCRR